MATTNTWRTIAERMARAIYPRRYPVKQTASGGAVGTWICASDGYPVTSTSAYRGVYIWIIYDAGGAAAAPENEIRAVTATGFTVASGTFAIQPNWTAAPASGDIALFLYGLHRDDLLEAANDCLRSTPLPRFLLASWCPDGDMENTGAWTAVGSATVTKETSFPMVGKQTTKIVTTATDTGATSANIQCNENENGFISALVKCTAGSIKVQLYDVTNSAEVDSVTVDEVQNTEVRFQFSVPSGCQNLAIRPLAQTAVTTAYINWAGAWFDGREYLDLTMTSTLDALDGADIEGVYQLPQGASSTVSESYIGFEEELQPWASSVALRDYMGAVSHRIPIRSPINNPLFLKFWAHDTALSALTDTTNMPVEVLVAGAAANCLQKLAAGTKDEGAKADYLNRAVAHANQFNKWKAALQLRRPSGGRTAQRRVSVA